MTTREFWLTQAKLLIMFLVIFVISLFFAGKAGEGSPVTLTIMAIGFVLMAWGNLMSVIKRCRDAGIDTWWTLATFLPYVGLLVVLVISFLKTKESE
jgi:uncharacterized membrane protein YhaH (DUF805 family)